MSLKRYLQVLEIFRFLDFRSNHFENCDVTMSVIKREGLHFWMHLLNRKSFAHETWQFIDIVRGNIFKKNFGRFCGLDPKSSSFTLSTYHNQNQLQWVSGFLTFWRCTQRESKSVNTLLKIHRSHYSIILSFHQTMKGPKSSF